MQGVLADPREFLVFFSKTTDSPLWGPNYNLIGTSHNTINTPQTTTKVGLTLAQRRDDSTDVGPTLGQPMHCCLGYTNRTQTMTRIKESYKNCSV